MPEWFRRPTWALDWQAWKDAANEVATLTGEHLPWPYNPEPPSAFIQLMNMVDAILTEAGIEE
jgi:hypothetical protein